jgi:hypothetical protein
MKMAFSSDGGGAGADSSYRIPEDLEEDRNSGDGIMPNRTATEDFNCLKVTL